MRETGITKGGLQNLDMLQGSGEWDVLYNEFGLEMMDIVMEEVEYP